MTDDRTSPPSVHHHPSSIFRCPRCGEGKLFSGFLTIADCCTACGLSLKAHEQGDGPAFFGILIIGTLAAMFAAIVEITYSPPFWLQAAIWVPFIVGGSIVCLRVLKAALISVQYRVKGEDFE